MTQEYKTPSDFGCCLFPDECCMPGMHYPSECHTVEYYECNEVFQMTEDEISAEFERGAPPEWLEKDDGGYYTLPDFHRGWLIYLAGAQMAIKKMGETGKL